jgi:protein TonB
MKLASFIVLSAGLHGVILVQPLSFPALEREQLLQVTIISLEGEGGAAGKKGPTPGNKARSAPSRVNTPENSLEPRFSAPLSVVVDKTPAPADSVDVSDGLSAALSSESMSRGADIFGVGGGGFGRESGGTGNSAAGSGAGSGRNMGNGHGQYTQARTSDAPKPKYPETARRDGKEGRVLLRVLVNEEGRTASVEVNRSSGVESLDQAALEAIKRWRFSPARLGDRPVKSWVRIPVDFRLNDVSD